MFNPTVSGIITVCIIYLLIYVEKNSVETQFKKTNEISDRDAEMYEENLKIHRNISMKVPIASGVLVWGFSNLILNNSNKANLKDQEILLERF